MEFLEFLMACVCVCLLAVGLTFILGAGQIIQNVSTKNFILMMLIGSTCIFISLMGAVKLVLILNGFGN